MREAWCKYTIDYLHYDDNGTLNAFNKSFIIDELSKVGWTFKISIRFMQYFIWWKLMIKKRVLKNVEALQNRMPSLYVANKNIVNWHKIW